MGSTAKALAGLGAAVKQAVVRAAEPALTAAAAAVRAGAGKIITQASPELKGFIRQLAEKCSVTTLEQLREMSNKPKLLEMTKMLPKNFPVTY